MNMIVSLFDLVVIFVFGGVLGCGAGLLIGYVLGRSEVLRK